MSYNGTQSVTPPIITIQFETMKHMIMQHMGSLTQEMQSTLELELSRAIEAFDLREYIQRIVRGTFEEQIKKAVERNLYELIYHDEDFNKEVTHMIGNTVRDIFKRGK